LEPTVKKRMICIAEVVALRSASSVQSKVGEYRAISRLILSLTFSNFSFRKDYVLLLCFKQWYKIVERKNNLDALALYQLILIGMSLIYEIISYL
jgi:hypothetical protein